MGNESDAKIQIDRLIQLLKTDIQNTTTRLNDMKVWLEAILLLKKERERDT